MALKASQIREIKNAKAWREQIWYWRTHQDVFIEEQFNVKLKDVQKVEARMFGNCDTQYFVQSRGFGKTWLTSVCALALGVQYPGSMIAVISGTAEQATLVLRKIDGYFVRNPDILREIRCDGKAPVQISRSKGICTQKNGSRIESFSIGTFRGQRAKILIIDEAPEVKKEDLEAVAKPVLNTTRDDCIQKGYKDFTSKMLSITSACQKSNYFYEAFVNTLKDISKGGLKSFACALDYRSAARIGITDLDFFLKEKKSMPESKFAMEYGSIFIGAEAGSVFPYEQTEKCRTLKEVEEAMPAKSTADYVMGIDLATSSKGQADNAVFTVLKLVECENGSYLKKLVYIRSFHGKRQDALAVETRRQLIKFPNISKVVFDNRGLGDAFPEFLSQPWIDPETKKEYPPLVLDTEKSLIHNALPILRPVIANNAINQQMVSIMLVNLEHGSLEIPVSSKGIIGNTFAHKDGEEDEPNVKLTMKEKAIFVEADALQIEMGNIVSTPTQSGAIIYDVAKATQHKDRYSSLAMALRYVNEIEEIRKHKILQGAATACIGIVTRF